MKYVQHVTTVEVSSFLEVTSIISSLSTSVFYLEQQLKQSFLVTLAVGKLFSHQEKKALDSSSRFHKNKV